MQYRPVMPDLPASHIAEGKLPLRYEDIAQDGRVNLLALPASLGPVVWQPLLGDHPLVAEGRARGIVPILSRFVLCGEANTVPVGRPLDARGGYQLAHTRDAEQAVNRLVLNIWTELSGIQGRTYAARPAGPPVHVAIGNLFAEHVFTRPFAPRDKRKVLFFSSPDLPNVPETQHAWRSFQDIVALPADATAHHSTFESAANVTFGLCHTDSNQHVNSLVYPRLFEQAVLQHLGARGFSTEVLSRYVEVSYRKPSFAGDRVCILLRTYDYPGGVGAVGCFAESGATAAEDTEAIVSLRPRCFVHLRLQP